VIQLVEFTRALEWDRFIDRVRSEARTLPGKSLLEDLVDPAQWAQDVTTAQILQQETQEAALLLDRDALWGPLTDLDDPNSILTRLRQNAVLEIGELVILRQWLFAIDSWTLVPREEIRGERFRKSLSLLPDPFNVLRILDRVLTPEGELSEKASPKLSQLHREIKQAKRDIQVLLDQLLKNYAGSLQDQYADIRDGRYVIPVKIGAQNEVLGIIHEASASRQTVFIEPQEVTVLNNRLRQLENHLIQEIYRILEETSRHIMPYADEIQAGVEILVQWDATQAKARLGLHYSGKTIRITEERRFSLLQTAHPLLWWSLPEASIIRNNIDFGDPSQILLLTGPNTGGKTVLLKTLGLAAICARVGFPFPATDHPTVPFFDSIFTDLGDPQSIEKQLSSFSGHILTLKEILENLTPRSLILIDELNSATDPQEGAAFARAVLETLIQRNAMVVTTTHDPHLKAYAIKNPQILSASMAFDEDSSVPTYQLLLGIPGRSRALETVARLGIPASIIELSQRYITEEHRSFEKMLTVLEQDTKEAAQARKKVVQELKEAERLKSEWLNRTQTSVNELIDKTRQRLRRILEQAQDEVRLSVKKLDEARSRKDLDKNRSHLNQIFADAASAIDHALKEESPETAQLLKSELPAPQAPQETPPLTLKTGSQVRIPKWKSTGTVLELIGSKAKVSMGTIQIIMPISDIELMPPMQQPAPSALQKSMAAAAQRPPAPGVQLDLRGLRLEDAIQKLEKYLDQAYRCEAYREVRVVHGMGTGALRDGSHRLMKELPYIKSFRDGHGTEGGSGVTIVEFEF